MPSRPSRHAVTRIAGLPRILVLTAVVVAACGPGPTTAPSASNPAATPTPIPGAPSQTPAASLPAQADTSWGRIWEALPAGFPRFAGAEPTDVGGSEPTSATLDVPTSAGSAADVMSFYRSALEAAGYSVSVDGPLEDGGYTISATGPAGCAAQISVVPLGGSITVTMLYGAACPFE